MEQMINENKIYNAALYCRLSKDDEQAGESVSIGTQKMILEKFCKEHDFCIFDVYVDDGFSGLNFERPEFQRMLKDIGEGKINLVITKDLSRLGRDYIQTGYYTEVYFQQKHVRYIAVNDGIDTNREDNDIAPFKNILNDMYAKDLSRKVKVAKRQRAYKGFFISAQTPYGYKIDPMDKNHLVVDEEVSGVVKEIFRLVLSGKSLVALKKIIRKLYEDFAEDLLDSESYHEMLSEYTQEQKKLSARHSMIDVELNSQEDYEKSVERLKSILDEYLTIEELSETMVNQLIEKIEIGHSQKVNGVKQQEITIVYRFVGRLED